MTTTPALAASDFSLQFGPVRPLDGVSLSVARGEVHGLLGENGSGKSSLIKCLSGYHQPMPGASLLLHGSEVSFPVDPRALHHHGLAFVHQDLGLIHGLTVLDNMVMNGLATSRRVKVPWSSERTKVQSLFDSFDLAVDLDAPISTLDKETQCLIAVVRAISLIEGSEREADGQEGILFLDEPSVYLSAGARNRLFSVVRRFTSRGGSAVLVSHDLDEVKDECDAVTVLRDGCNVAEVQVEDVSTQELVRLILGSDPAPVLPTGARAVESNAAAAVPVQPAVSVRGLSAHDGSVLDVAFDLAPGEVLGLTGLMGSGFEHVPYLLQGDGRCLSGSMILEDEELDLSKLTIARAIRKGICLVPAERPRLGMALTLSLADNLVLPPLVMRRYFRRGFMRHREIHAHARRMLETNGVKPRTPGSQGWQLSGGNQQKVVVAKWMDCEPRFLLMHEPTQGVDIGARAQISDALRSIADQGTPVLCASNDHEQLAQVCDRVLIFSEGRPVLEVSGPDVTKTGLTDRCLTSSRPVRRGSSRVPSHPMNTESPAR